MRRIKKLRIIFSQRISLRFLYPQFTRNTVRRHKIAFCRAALIPSTWGSTLIEYIAENEENEEIIPFRGVQFPRGYPYPKLKQLRASRPLKSEGIYKYNAIKHIAPQRGRLAILPYRPVQNTPGIIITAAQFAFQTYCALISIKKPSEFQPISLVCPICSRVSINTLTVTAFSPSTILTELWVFKISAS